MFEFYRRTPSKAIETFIATSHLGTESYLCLAFSKLTLMATETICSIIWAFICLEDFFNGTKIMKIVVDRVGAIDFVQKFQNGSRPHDFSAI